MPNGSAAIHHEPDMVGIEPSTFAQRARVSLCCAGREARAKHVLIQDFKQPLT
jgi:hypothetical protein